MGFVALSVSACAGVIEIATARIMLAEDILEVRRIWSRRRYRAADIEAATWEKGSRVSLKLAQGGWVKLPEMGYNSQSLANSPRAWLKNR